MPPTQPIVSPPPPVETPDGIGIKIDDVNKSLKDYILKRKLAQFIAAVIIAIGWETVAVLFVVPWLLNNSANTGTNSSGKSVATVILLPIVLFTAWIARLKAKFEEAFLQEFALSNGFAFSKTGGVNEAYGTIFRLQGQQAISDIITGTYRSNDLRLFLYQLTTGFGRDRTAHNDTVIELDLHGQLPNLLMVNKKSHYGQLDLAGSFGTTNTIGLEGDFNQYFTLYAPANTQIEALEVFSPDTMALMEDDSRHFTVEFAANRIYIYANGYITTTEQLTGVFTLAKKLIDKLGPLASRLTNDSSVVLPPVNLTQSSQPSASSLRTTRRLVTIIVIVVALTALFVGIVSIINGISQS